MGKKRKISLFRILKAIITKIEDTERWLAYRTYERYNIVETDLPKSYFTYEQRLFHACFSLLVDHVEIELASYIKPEPSDLPDWKEIILRRMPRPWIIDYILPPHRSSKYGIRALENRINDQYMDDCYDYQADREKSKQILELYKWWKFIRPKRKDSTELSGLLDFCTKMNKKYDGDFYKWTPVGNNCLEMGLKLNKEEEAEYCSLLDISGTIEADQEKEDNDMLNRLINLRSYWGS